MKTRYLIVLLLLQAVYAYFIWPNNIFLEPNWFSSLAFILTMAPFLFLTLYLSWKRALLWCGFSAMAMMLPGLVFLTDMSYFPVTSYFIYLLIAIITFSIGAVTGGLGSWINQHVRWGFILVLPALFISQEFVRVFLSESLWLAPPPSNVYAAPMLGVLPIAQMASLTGIYGPAFLGFFITAVAVFITYEKLLEWDKGRAWLAVPDQVRALALRDRGKTIGVGVAVLALMILLVVLGNMDAVNVADQQKESKRMIKPALLQTNYDVSAAPSWNRTVELRTTRLIREMVMEAKDKGGELLLFTENAVPGYLPSSTLLWRDLKLVFEEAQLPVFIGIITSGNNYRNYNIWYYLDQKADIQDYYVKRYMIPFGEYMPMRPILSRMSALISRLTKQELSIQALSIRNENIYDLTRGLEEKIFTVNDVKVSLKICAEIFFARYFRESVNQGAEVFLGPSASNWFQKPADYYQHVVNARLRAIESRRWVVYSASMAGSVVVDALGVVRQASAFNEKSILVTELPALQGKSFYVKSGDLFAYACVLILLGFIALAYVRSKQIAN